MEHLRDGNASPALLSSRAATSTAAVGEIVDGSVSEHLESAVSAATPGTGVLLVRGLSVERGGRRVLHDVDLVLSRGDRAVLCGGSGEGKSTLATALSGILPSLAGCISLDADESTDLGWRERVGLVPQHGDNHVLLAPAALTC